MAGQHALLCWAAACGRSLAACCQLQSWPEARCVDNLSGLTLTGRVDFAGVGLQVRAQPLAVLHGGAWPACPITQAACCAVQQVCYWRLTTVMLPAWGGGDDDDNNGSRDARHKAVWLLFGDNGA